MKKALITILMIMTLSAGIFFSAFSHVSADTLTPIDTIEVNGREVSFYTPYAYYDSVQVQYTYLENDVLITRVENYNAVNNATRISDQFNWYKFTIDDRALSFIIKKAMDGTVVVDFAYNEYIYSEDTRIQYADMSVHQVVINEDLITKNPVYSESGQLYEFWIHFNIEDGEENTIPIDRIVKATYTYDVVFKNFGQFYTRDTKIVEIDPYVYHDTPTINPVFPYFTYPWIEEQIKSSDEDGFTWMIDLGTYRASSKIKLIGDVNIDQTQLMMIEYYSEGEYIATDDIVDDPYDMEDIRYDGVLSDIQGILVKINDALGSLGDTMRIIIYVVVAILLIIILLTVFKAINLVLAILKLLGNTVLYIGKSLIWFLKALILVLKYAAYFAYRVAKFIAIDSTILTIKFIYYLIIPKDKRKEQVLYHDI